MIRHRPKFDVTEGQIHDLVKSLTANLPDYSNPDNIKELKDRGIQVGDAAKNLIKDAAKAAKAEADPKDALKGAVNLVKDVAKPGFDLFANALNDRNAFHNLVGNYVPAYVRGVEKTVAVPSSQPPLIERSGGIGQLGDRKAGLQAVRAGNRDGQDAAKKTSAQDIATLKKVLQETKSARMFEQKLSEELVEMTGKAYAVNLLTRSSDIQQPQSVPFAVSQWDGRKRCSLELFSQMTSGVWNLRYQQQQKEWPSRRPNW